MNSIPKLPASLRLVDGKPAPHMRPFVHTEYVDNFVALSQSQGLVKELAAEVQGALQERGLPTHEVEATVGGDTLGWHFSDTSPTVTVTTRRLWKLRLATDELLARGWGTGQLLEKFIGHFTFAARLATSRVPLHLSSLLLLYSQVLQETFSTMAPSAS